MAKREKRIEKQIQGLLNQAGRHMLKVNLEAGRKDTTKEYWLKEIERFEKRAGERASLLKKLMRKKSLK